MYLEAIKLTILDKMRKKGTLEKTGLLKDLQTGAGGMGPESLLVSYLLVGHKDFKGSPHFCHRFLKTSFYIPIR